MSYAKIIKSDRNHLTDKIDEVLLREQAERKYFKPEHFFPSGLPYACPRQLFYSLSGEEPSDLALSYVTPVQQRVRDLGDATHKVVQRYLKQGGILIQKEVLLRHYGLNIKGRGDALIRLDDMLMLVEIKSTRIEQFPFIKSPYKKHIQQAALGVFCLRYMQEYLNGHDIRSKYLSEETKKILAGALPIKKFVVCYYCKNDSEMKDFIRVYRYKLIEPLVKKIKIAQNALDCKIPPDRECKTKRSPIGKTCIFRSLCFEES